MGFESSTDIGRDSELYRRKQQRRAPRKDPSPEEPDPGKIEEWIKELSEYRTYFYLAVLIILAVFSFTQTARLPLADSLAQDYAENAVKQNIYQDVDEEMPFLPQDSKRKEVEKRFQDVKETESYKSLARNRSEIFRDYYQNFRGQTYIFGGDAYYYVRQAENLLDNNYLGKIQRNGRNFDNLRAAPSGIPIQSSLFPYIIVGFSYIASPTEPAPIKGAFWMPVILGILSTLIIYRIANILFNKEVGFISGLAFVMHPGIFTIFKAGTADTQVTNVFFSILISYFVIKASIQLREINHSEWKEWISPGTYLGLTIISYILFNHIWRGSPYILAVILGSAFLYVFLLARRENERKYWYTFGGMGLVAALGFYMAKQIGFLRTVLTRLGLKESAAIFPAVGSTVSELQRLTFTLYPRKLGILPLILGAIGLFTLIYKEWKNPTEKTYLLGWGSLTIVPLFASRFYFYALPALAILTGYGLYKSAELFTKWRFGLTTFMRKFSWTTFLTILLVAFTIPSLSSAWNIHPTMDDAIYEMSQDVRIKTSQDTIINSWWDYGYIYQHYMNRPTTLDGGYQDSQKIYWTSKALMAKEENRSAGILRMLNCGAAKNTFRELKNQMSASESVKLMERAAGMTREKAVSFYESMNASPALANKTHCEAPPGILIIDNGMLAKREAINHFAKWNFNLGLSTAEEIRFADANCYGNICDNGIRFSLEEEKATIQNRPVQKFIYVNRTFGNKTVITNTSEEAVEATIIVKENDLYIMKPGFEETLLIKGLLLNDMERFDLFKVIDKRKRLAAYNINY